jgi:hypothetical protein
MQNQQQQPTWTSTLFNQGDDDVETEAMHAHEGSI